MLKARASAGAGREAVATTPGAGVSTVIVNLCGGVRRKGTRTICHHPIPLETITPPNGLRIRFRPFLAWAFPRRVGCAHPRAHRGGVAAPPVALGRHAAHGSAH